MPRPAGSLNTKTVQWNRLGNIMVDSGAKRVRKIMDGLDDKEFIQVYLSLLQYFKPKRQSSSVKQVGEINVSVISSDKDIVDKI